MVTLLALAYCRNFCWCSASATGEAEDLGEEVEVASRGPTWTGKPTLIERKWVYRCCRWKQHVSRREAPLEAMVGCCPAYEAQVGEFVCSEASAWSVSILLSAYEGEQRRLARWSVLLLSSYSEMESRIFVHATSLCHWEGAGRPGYPEARVKGDVW